MLLWEIFGEKRKENVLYYKELYVSSLCEFYHEDGKFRPSRKAGILPWETSNGRWWWNRWSLEIVKTTLMVVTWTIF